MLINNSRLCFMSFNEILILFALKNISALKSCNSVEWFLKGLRSHTGQYWLYFTVCNIILYVCFTIE